VIELSERQSWDAEWESQPLPVVYSEEQATPHGREILRSFRRLLAPDPAKTVLEIGAGVGGYLAYMSQTFGYRAHALDYSPVACRRLAENFRLLGLPVEVFERDLLEGRLDGLPQFDLVYSLGLIEHFTDPMPVIAGHARLTKKGGLLLLGVPNFGGVNRVFLQIFKPWEFADLNTATMDLDTWTRFEAPCGLEPIFKGYVGGWEPGLYVTAGATLKEKIGNRIFGLLGKALRRRRRYWTVNSRWWSGYALALYRKTSEGT